MGLLDAPEDAGLRRGLILDLAYEEDHRAAVDANLVATRPLGGGELELAEFQATGEGRSYTNGTKCRRVGGRRENGGQFARPHCWAGDVLDATRREPACHAKPAQRAIHLPPTA